MLNTKVIIR